MSTTCVLRRFAQGYRNFGFTINHAGDASQFETSGSITTPFTQVPRVDYTLRYRAASLADFSISASAAYSGKKIEVRSWIFKTNKKKIFVKTFIVIR